MRKRIMLLARDPGGANTIIPLAEPLRERGYQVDLYGKDAALKNYRRMGLNGRNVTTILPEIKTSCWEEFLCRRRPDFIITGTSGDDFTERYLWQAARNTGISTFAILDQWMNYGIRFSDYTLKEQEQYRQNKLHPYLPDYILVMDETARQEMIGEGIDGRRVKISGQPYFDLLMSARDRFPAEQILAIKRELGSRNELIITFISEPISQDYADENRKLYWGFDEKSACRVLLRTLKKILEPSDQRVQFIIKQHPRENQDNYSFLGNEFTDGPIGIRIVRDMDSWSLLRASDLVCGMSSMLLLEAIILGCPVLSIQIGLNRASPLILAQRGILAPILKAEELEDTLRAILLDKERPVINWHIESGAVDKVIAYMEELL
ncbi:hypothetical protein [Syntrophomonas wolfei]|uniref:hypothetical protein n=1 Tax=Syntrophomonas wolfei TaxID=863 RepID=UPI0023F2E987|nr:hypothetical protein [Syntrophomonas wolfei]